MPKTISLIQAQPSPLFMQRVNLLSVIIVTLFIMMSALSAHAQTPLRKIAATPAPNISFYGKDGANLSLSQWRGKVVVVNLWATWCTPCIAEMPSLNEFAARYVPLGVTVIPLSIGQDDVAKIQAFYTQYGLNTFNVARDPEHAALRAFGVSGLPSSFIIDKAGNLVGQIDGATDWNDVQLNAYIKFLLS